jgi:hypothetical protein
MFDLVGKGLAQLATGGALQADGGVPGKRTGVNATESPFVPPSAEERVKAYAGETVTYAGYVLEATHEGTFVVRSAPAGAPTETITRTSNPQGYQRAASLLFQSPPRGARDGGTAAPPTPGLDAHTLVDRSRENDGVAPPAVAPAPANTAVDTNLAQAEYAAQHLNVPHTYDAGKTLKQPKAPGANATDEEKAAYATARAAYDDQQREARRIAAGIVAGSVDPKQIPHIVCSGFTALTLARSGIDLTSPYRDPATRLPIWFNGRFITIYEVVQNTDATHAVIFAHRGGKNVQRIEPRSLGRLGVVWAATTGSKDPFLWVADGDVGELAATDEFGAGAAAHALGGAIVAQEARKPGDVQQMFWTHGGKTDFSGHSSTVWAVRGQGVVYLGATGSPRLTPELNPAPPPGWYELRGVYAELEPQTDPALVASFSTSYVQLVEATNSRTDATRKGPMQGADNPYDPDAGTSQLTSTGRLPTSKWFHWGPSEPARVGVIDRDGVHPPPGR